MRVFQRLLAGVRRSRHERLVDGFITAADGRAGPFPEVIVYEPTMRCNLRCGFCYVGGLLNVEGESRQELSLDVLTRVFPPRTGLRINLTGGEIFCRRDMVDVLALFRDKGYACGYLTTNGVLIDDARADALSALAAAGFLKHVSVSIDGPGSVHDQARGVAGTFERTAAGLRRLQEAAARRHAPLRLSINTTVTRQSLGTLERVAEVARELGIDAIGLNHLMFATSAEVAETARLLGTTDVGVISTFVTDDAGVTPGEVRIRVEALERACRQQRVRFDVRPKVTAGLMQSYYTSGAPLSGRCLYPFLNARVSSTGKVFFCPFIRIEVGDLTSAPLEAIWNGDRYVDLRRRLLESRLFPVCRRCCKVELSAAAR